MFGKSVESKLVVDAAEVGEAAEVRRVDAQRVLVALTRVLELASGLEDEATHVRQVVAEGRPRSKSGRKLKSIGTTNKLSIRCDRSSIKAQLLFQLCRVFKRSHFTPKMPRF